MSGLGEFGVRIGSLVVVARFIIGVYTVWCFLSSAKTSKRFFSRAGRRAGPSDAEVTSRGSLGGMSMLLTRTHCAIVCCSAPMLKPFVYMGGVRSSSSECLWRQTVRADDTTRIAVSFFEG